MQKSGKKTKYRINAKRFILFVFVLVLAVIAGFFVIRAGIRVVETKKEAARLAEEKRLLEEQIKAEEEAALAAEQEAKRLSGELAREERVYAYENGFLLLLNKENSVGETYKAEDMVSIDEEYCCSDRPASTHFLREEAAEAFVKMADAAKAAGYTIRITTAYRSYSYQNTLYTNYVSNHGQTEADRFSAKPGTSEHQSGLAADLSAESVSWQLTSKLGDTEEGKWIEEHCAEYGFILRYPREDSEERTGYIYEPWHVRYVTVPVATEIMEKGLVLEEYLALYNWPAGTEKAD